MGGLLQIRAAAPILRSCARRSHPSRACHRRRALERALGLDGCDKDAPLFLSAAQGPRSACRSSHFPRCQPLSGTPLVLCPKFLMFPTRNHLLHLPMPAKHLLCALCPVPPPKSGQMLGLREPVRHSLKSDNLSQILQGDLPAASSQKKFGGANQSIWWGRFWEMPSLSG